MRGRIDRQASMFVAFNIEDRIAQDHPLRRVKAWADRILQDMRRDFDAAYAKIGRPGIPPEQLLKIPEPGGRRHPKIKMFYIIVLNVLRNDVRKNMIFIYSQDFVAVKQFFNFRRAVGVGHWTSGLSFRLREFCVNH